MKPSEDLFELIKSLNQTEKRYFKVYASKSGAGDNVYIRLFDAIENQEKYDEKALRQKFANEAFVRQLHVAKNYLYKVILKSLASYHSKTSVNAQVLEMLRVVEVLDEKGFYKQGEKILKRAKELCIEYEKYLLLAQFCEWECKIISRKSELGKMQAVINEEQRSLDAMRQMLDYKKKAFSVYDKVVALGVARDQSEMSLFKNEMKAAILNKDDRALSNEARYYKYSAFSLFASATGDRKKHYEYTRKILDIFEKSDALRNEYPYHYISSINNLCNALFYLDRNEEVVKLVKKMRDFCNEFGVNKWEDAYFTGLLLSYDIEITAYMNTGQFHKINDLIAPVDELLKNHGAKAKKSHVLDLVYDISYGLFILKDYNRSLDWLLKIINDRHLPMRYDIYCASRILHLLLHFELGNELLLRNIIRPTMKYLDRKKRLFQPERILLKFLDAQMRVKDKESRERNFRILQAEIANILKKTLERNVLQYFDIPSWIESKVERKDLRDVLQSKNAKAK